MKTFDELTDAQKERAVDKCVEDILRGLCEGWLEVEDDAVMENVQAALVEAERLQTPWFAGGIIMERVEQDVYAIAESWASELLYSEPHEVFVSGVIIEEDVTCQSQE